MDRQRALSQSRGASASDCGRPVSRLLLSLVVLAAQAPAVASAEDPPKPQALTPAATTQPAEMPTNELRLMLRPLTKAELVIEADAWMALLKDKVTEISRTEIAAVRAEGDAKAALLDQVSKARDERVRLTDRLSIVLAELKAKGGAVADYESYINAVTGVAISVEDVGATWSFLTDWLRSPEGGIRYGRNVLFFVGTLVIFRILAAVVAGVMRRALSRFKAGSNLLRDFTVNTTRKIVFFIGFVVALSMLEVNIGPFLAAIGAIGFIIGFALQGTMSNFAAGIMILLYRPYDLNDMVTVTGVTGRVESMSLVSTVLRNKDQHAVIIPNSAIWGGTITNLGPAQTT
ncbi:MAG: mechanosensitive ion channel family protein [Phycisphaerae bacterium]|jgi:small conductance mechanosensitive channel|nr:mechanosensitive ion channel [Phycisphaerae bacterium]MCZ2399979.1 mechanosensitive ion channel family protein [Phycisphaerae bacterium]NUQ49010.1 mechanosensitive ion channel [Phycisphaerae bacterium]